MINTSHRRHCLHPLAIRDPQSSLSYQRPSILHRGRKNPIPPPPCQSQLKCPGSQLSGDCRRSSCCIQTRSGLRRQETLQSQNAACLGKAANSLSQPLKSSSLGFSILSYKSHNPKLTAYAVLCLFIEQLGPVLFGGQN